MKIDQNNCLLIEADIAFFPMIDTSRPLESIPLHSKEMLTSKVIGIAELPVIVPNRLRFRRENGRTVTKNDTRLEFSFVESSKILSPSEMNDFYDSLIFFKQKNAFASVWVLAPKDFCIYIHRNCLKGNGGKFYYHTPMLSASSQYFAIGQTSTFFVTEPVNSISIFG